MPVINNARIWMVPGSAFKLSDSFSGIQTDSSIELLLLSGAMIYSYDLAQTVSKCDHSD
jgi:hypothetical protein